MKAETIKGRVTMTPKHGISKNNKAYASFVIETSTGDLMNCVCFDSIAEMVADKVKADMSIGVIGRTGDDGSLMLNGISIPNVGEAARASNYRVAPPEPMRVDGIMDKLGAAYVSKRVMDWSRASQKQELVPTKSGMFRMSFDAKGFWALLDELDKEIDEWA